MNTNVPVAEMAVDELMAEAIRIEKEALRFYRSALPHVEHDAHHLFCRLIGESEQRIRLLTESRTDLRNLRELAGAIAD